MGFDFSSVKSLQNVGSSASGNISKAILCIRKVESVAPSPKVKKKDQGIDQLTPAETKAIDDVVKVNEKLMALAEKTLKGGKTASFKDVRSAVEGQNYLALELQYNPSSLRLDTTAGRQMKYEGGAGDVQLKEYVAPSSTTLSCELLFDDVNNMDAFMLADNPLTGATPSNIANTATSAIKGKYSVQRQMEGLLSLLTVPEARHVVFFWGSMCFRGEMTEVTTTYTMFNKKGYPIRGTVGIQIRQGDGNEGVTGIDKEFRYDESQWRKSFDATFTEKGSGLSGWRKATTNNILNLKL